MHVNYFYFFTGEVSPEIERQHVQYEDWLMKHSQYLEMQIKALETQIAKCKRTKKAINARNRQVIVYNGHGLFSDLWSVCCFFDTFSQISF